MRNRVAITIIAAAVTIVAAYLAGYLPERGARVDAAARAAVLDTRLTATEARVRTAELLGRAIDVREAAMRNDFGRAGELASPLFDSVRGEVGATTDERLRGGLNDVLAGRDRVTAALARADPASVAALHEIEIRLRSALGYPVFAPAQ